MTQQTTIRHDYRVELITKTAARNAQPRCIDRRILQAVVIDHWNAPRDARAEGTFF